MTHLPGLDPSSCTVLVMLDQPFQLLFLCLSALEEPNITEKTYSGIVFIKRLNLLRIVVLLLLLTYIY